MADVCTGDDKEEAQTADVSFSDGGAKNPVIVPEVTFQKIISPNLVK
jgi:hypothetical protein